MIGRPACIAEISVFDRTTVHMVAAALNQRRRLKTTKHCNKQESDWIGKKGDSGAAGTLPPCVVVRRVS
jgi:hypothetical protein